MRLDHIAYRTADRKKTAQFFMDAFGYKIQTEFDINFKNGTTAKCIALEPPEKLAENAPWTCMGQITWQTYHPNRQEKFQEYHLAPEIFVSDGDPDSIVGKWVERRNGVGGIHHMAYMVDSVQEKMNEWKLKGYAEFASEQPLTCPDLTQVFTRPSELTGVIYEFIQRGKHGFCQANVENLMESTKNFS